MCYTSPENFNQITWGFCGTPFLLLCICCKVSSFSQELLCKGSCAWAFARQMSSSITFLELSHAWGVAHGVYDIVLEFRTGTVDWGSLYASCLCLGWTRQEHDILPRTGSNLLFLHVHNHYPVFFVSISIK